MSSRSPADGPPTVDGGGSASRCWARPGASGRQALDVLERHADRFRVVALASGRNAAELARPGRPPPPRRRQPRRRRRDRSTCRPGTERIGGADALEALATRDDVDLVVVGTGGVVSLRPVLAALRAGKVVATANKETLVAGGHLVMAEARARAAERADSDAADPLATPLAWLRPIDSEHSAIWQCLVGEPRAGDRASRAHRLRRPVPRRHAARARGRDPGAGAAPPDVVDGRQDHDRLARRSRTRAWRSSRHTGCTMSTTTRSTSSSIRRASSTRPSCSSTAR